MTMINDNGNDFYTLNCIYIYGLNVDCCIVWIFWENSETKMLFRMPIERKESLSSSNTM